MKMFKCLALCAILVSSIPAFAIDGQSVSLGLQGSVAQKNEIVITPAAYALAIDILGGSSAVKIADVMETSNSYTGYTIQMSSLNGGVLKHVESSGLRPSLAYSIGYVGGLGSAGVFAAPVILPGQARASLGPLNALSVINRQVQLTMAAVPAASAGTYTDSLTFTIAHQ